MPQSARADGHGNVIIQIQGDGNSVVEKLPHLELTLYAQRRRVHRLDGEEVGADLVSPYTLSIPLIGREDSVADLREWLGSGAPLSVRVLVGTAGRGKTRLALELCEALRAEGWQTGFLTSAEMGRFRGQQNLRSWGWNAPTLIVIDYVVSQAAAVHDWLVELADNKAQGNAEAGREQPLRILLLERQADIRSGWWMMAFGQGGGDARAVRRLLDPAEPVVLPAIDHVETRRAVIAAMLERAGRKERPPAAGDDPAFDRRLTELSWGGEPLFLMMAGLAAARSGFAAALSLSPDELAFDLADRELERVCRIARGKGIDEALARHMVAVATLSQGLEREAALEAIEREKAALRYGEAGGAIPAVYEALREALPREGGGLDPILPNVIGEAVLLRVWDRHEGRDGVPVVLRAVEAAQGDVAATVVRTCQDFAIRGHEEPLRWLEALGERAATDLPALLELANALPEDTLVLREMAARLTETILGLLPTTGEEARSETARSLRATALNNLAIRLGALGRREAALEAIKEAVALYRALAVQQPDAFRPGLAKSLNNLSNRLGDLGRREEALAAIKETVAIRRKLAAQRPDAYRLDLGTSLNNLSGRLGDLGRREAALEASEEAVAIHRELATQRPDAFRPDLAMSLNNLAACLGALGRQESALKASEEAGALYRALAAQRPDAFRPNLAGALNNLSNLLGAVGRHEAALKASEEAVALYRELAAQRHNAFQSDLASSLNNLADRLDALDRREAALEAIEEAVALYRELSAQRPDAIRPDLATSLNNLSAYLDALGHREAALEAIKEAVAIRRELSAQQPGAFRPDLAGSLNNLSVCLAALSRREDALAASEEAVRTLKDDFLHLPQAHAQEMSTLMRNYFKRCEACEREPDMDLVGQIVSVFEQIEA